MIPKNSTSISSEQAGFTFIEVIISCLILMVLIGAVIHYHRTSGASADQIYYLKAVQTARAELQKLKALYEVSYELSPTGLEEFTVKGAPPNEIFLFKFNEDGIGIMLPSNLFHVYYDDYGYTQEFLRPLGDSPPYNVNEKNTALEYQEYYKEAYQIFSDTDDIDKKTFTYFTGDNFAEYPPDSDKDNGKIDASIVVIDDMGSPEDPDDDLLGNIGWWVESIPPGGPNCLKVTFVLQFWYPGQRRTQDPEVIVLKTTMVKP